MKLINIFLKEIRMNYDAYMLLWQNAYVQMKHINYINKSKVQVSKVLTNSSFLIITAGEAQIVIDEQPYYVQRFSIFHIGKSQCLQINAQHSVSYFLIRYEGDVIYKDAFMQHLQMQYQPFQINFSCVPANPIAIHNILQDMYSKWISGSIQDHFSVKASLYEFVYRMFQELADGQGNPHEMDKAEVARLYIHQHLHQPLSIQSLADTLHISTRHLLRIFKARYGVGPQIYLQQLRIEQAKQYLLENQFGIKEIAISLGYEDEYYFSRAFKKATNMAPSNFRLKYASFMSEMAITNENHFQYNENQLAQAHRFEIGENEMMMQKMIQHIKLPFFLSLFVLLAACNENSVSTKVDHTISDTIETRMVTDDSGREVEIPVRAKRVITDWYLGQILALDIVPVGGVTANLDYAAFLKQHYKDGEITNIGTDGKVSLEKILELKPDLIITWNPEDVGKYEKIAPTIVFAEDAHSSAREEIEAMGNYLGRQKEAEIFMDAFEERLAQAKVKINDVIPDGATFTIYEMFEKNATIVGNSSVSGGRALYQILGMKPQEKVQELFDAKEASGGRYEISYEVVGDYVGDYNFMINFFNKDGKLPGTWTNLDVVKNNQIIELPSEYYFASDPLSGLHQAEELADKIVEFTKARQK